MKSLCKSIIKSTETKQENATKGLGYRRNYKSLIKITKVLNFTYTHNDFKINKKVLFSAKTLETIFKMFIFTSGEDAVNRAQWWREHISDFAFWKASEQFISATLKKCAFCLLQVNTKDSSRNVDKILCT